MSDKKDMLAVSCCTRSFRQTFATLSRAAAKAAGTQLRKLRGEAPARGWADRAAVCERCPMRVIERNISYCGRPLLQHINRDEATHGCGCPTIAKARTAGEHCPVDQRYRPAQRRGDRCTCKWCSIAAG
jgi:hypothetical protein